MEMALSIPPKLCKDIRTSEGYIGIPNNFLLSTSWVRHANVDTLFNSQCTLPVQCCVIGTVVEDGLCIEAHGDFIPPGDMKQAFKRFSLGFPQDPSDALSEEFRTGVANLQTLVNIQTKYSVSAVSEIIGKRLVDETQQTYEPVITFKHKIFARKVLSIQSS